MYYYKIRHIAYALLAASLMTACTRDESGYTAEVDGAVLTFTVGISTTTRSTVDNSFENGDAISVTINEETATYTYYGSEWTSESPYYWKNATETVTVEAECFGGKAEGEYAVQANQSSDEAYQAGDYLYAPATTFTYGATNSLTFFHQTAKLVLNLVDGNTLSNADNVAITIGGNNLALEGTFAKPTTSGDNFGTWTTETGNSSITPYKLDSPNTVAGKTINASYVALAIPQSVTAGYSLISIVIDNQTFNYNPSTAITWNPGKVYTYTITVNYEGLEVEESSINDWEEGDSTEIEMQPDYTIETNGSETTYIVYTADGLLAWNQAASNNTSISCTLADDINISNSEWTLVGSNYENQYTGTFDGGGHTITGLTINSSADYVGLIGYLGSSGQVQNLTLDNVSVTGNSYVGGVVGYNYYGTVTDCTASGEVSGSSNHVGGVVGYNWFGTVTDCHASCDVDGTSHVGGVVGYNNGDVTACTASGKVYGSSNYVGGVVGYNISTTSSTVTACYHTSGNVTGYSRVGGVIGCNNGTVTACYHASGSVSTTYSNPGGVVGTYEGGTVTACYWDCDYESRGIGSSSGSGEATEVDGTTTTWQNAVDGMNEAIDKWNTDNSGKRCDWKYEIAVDNDLPTLTKSEE